MRIQGEGSVNGDLGANGMGKPTRQFVLGVVHTAESLPLIHTVHPGNLSETGTLQAMVQTVLKRFPVQRVILLADRGLLSQENIAELTAITDQGGRSLEFIFAVPARRYADLVPTFRNLNFDEAGFAEGTFEDLRLIATHDPLRAKAQSEHRRSQIAELEELAVTMVARLDAQDEGETVRGRRASDREAHSHFAHAVSKARLTRFIKADLQAEHFSWFVDEDAISNAELFDGKLALLTNVKDLTPDEMVSRYIARSDIKRGFRILKSDIEIAPVHHRFPERIRAHAMIYFLALALYRVMRMRLKARQHNVSPQTALKLLSRIQKHTTYIDDRTFNGASKTTQEQLDLLTALGLPEPT